MQLSKTINVISRDNRLRGTKTEDLFVYVGVNGNAELARSKSISAVGSVSKQR